jgi:hypothetical protein
MIALALPMLLAGPPSCRTGDPRVEAVIAAKVHETGGDEYCQARIYQAFYDVDGDDREDFIVVFTVEAAAGGNDSVQYMAVLQSARGWRPSVMLVGRRGVRFIDSVDVEEERTIVLATSEYAKGDAMCCPSEEGELRYRLVKGQLVPAPDEAPPAPKAT